MKIVDDYRLLAWNVGSCLVFKDQRGPFCSQQRFQSRILAWKSGKVILTAQGEMQQPEGIYHVSLYCTDCGEETALSTIQRDASIRIFPLTG